jgi:hypothetical protein
MAIHIKKSHQGLLHKNLGVAQGKPIPAGKLAKAEKSPSPAVRKRAVFAANAKKWHHGGSKAKGMSKSFHSNFKKAFPS